MILWILLFVLVVAISFVLAAKSMRDFTEVPSEEEEYSLYLIRKTPGLSKDILDSIHQDLSGQNRIISFERLFKGGKSALVVFGPSKLILKYKDSLDLLELEDYTDVNVSHIFAWEAGIKSSDGRQKIFGNLPQLSETEQFWWQVIISTDFKPQITAIVVSEDATKKHSLSQSVQNMAKDIVIKLPKAFSNAQILDFYKIRSIRGGNNNPTLSSEQILQLLLL